MRAFVIVLGLMLLASCSPSEDSSGTKEKGQSPSTSNEMDQSQPGGGSTSPGGGDNVQVLTGGGAGGATPVVGGENMGGSGGGVGMAAKDAARGAATKVHGSEPESTDEATPNQGD
ncbi:MAG: hypothetical protein JNM34_08610 [Chthonomonadaceae bacterium]|nr:hypothetical protein [Chthonomonadaceae bacterium]